MDTTSRDLFLFYISDKRAAISLEDIITFWTGADSVLPCGFDKKLLISFYPMEEGVKRLPSASTCALCLWLPRGAENPEEFQTLVEYAINGTQGFGKI